MAILEQVIDWTLIKQDKAATAIASRLDSITNLNDFMQGRR